MSEHITDHADRALGRLAQEFKGKPLLAGLIRALVSPLQSIEDAADQVEHGTSLEDSVGVQLDRMGVIVGQERAPGQSDTAYLLSLKTKIVENVSQGEPETIIAIYQLLLGASRVFLDDMALMAVGLGSEIQLADQAHANALFAIIKKIVMGTVRVDYLSQFDLAKPFAFAGNHPGGGFGTAGDGSVGGGFATLWVDKTKKFAFAGPEPWIGGFGTVKDPLVGGYFD